MYNVMYVPCELNLFIFQLVCKGILKFCLRGLLGDRQRETLYEFFDCLTVICAESQTSESIDILEVRLNTAMAHMERDFPMTIQVIMQRRFVDQK